MYIYGSVEHKPVVAANSTKNFLPAVYSFGILKKQLDQRILCRGQIYALFFVIEIFTYRIEQKVSMLNPLAIFWLLPAKQRFSLMRTQRVVRTVS